MKEEELRPKNPKPMREHYGLPLAEIRKVVTGEEEAAVAASRRRIGNMTPSIKANAVGRNVAGVCYFKGK